MLAELSRRATVRIAFQHIALPRRLMDVVELLEGKRWIDEDNRRVESNMDQNDDVGPIRYHRIRKRRSVRDVRCFAGVERHVHSHDDDVDDDDDDEDTWQKVIGTAVWTLMQWLLHVLNFYYVIH